MNTTVDTKAINLLLFWIFLASVTLFFASCFMAERLPPRTIHPSLDNEPVQTPLRSDQLKTFYVRRQGHIYAVTPKWNYTIKGLVASLSNSQSWLNISHASWKDFFNIGDLCLLWGPNARSPYFKNLSFWNGDWTCNVQANTSESWAAFHMNKISNNHILPATPAIEKAFKSIRVGDQIGFSGQLVNYSIDGGSERNSSTTREDTGNGACEVVYVQSIFVIEEGHRIWRKIEKISGRLAGFSFVIVFFLTFIMPFLNKKRTL